ncbi:hypothetical protein ACLQ3C_09805 [Gordonia sp. DT30]|uniref:hypothetical protein n=1 Tax=unclassified Gordonia (in: high G+C Gram-positive bacteria) TaxID=2657482 RepID=UPI003CF5CD5F
MNLAQFLATNSAVQSEILGDPLVSGLGVCGIPPKWRATVMESVTTNPGPVWCDIRAAESSRDETPGDSIPPFSSQATVVGWVMHNIQTTPTELVRMAADMTESTPGWSQVSTESAGLGPDAASSYMFGTLDSPYGPLVSNIQNIGLIGPARSMFLVQLVVTATAEWKDDVVGVRLYR